MFRSSVRRGVALATVMMAAAVSGMPVAAQVPSAELSTRIDRLEAQIRQLTGAIEQLQHRNQLLEGQLRRMQEPTRPVATPTPGQPPTQAPAAPPAGRRSEVFDPAQHPNAPGAPRVLGTLPSADSAPTGPDGEVGVGAPGGRAAGAPLDLSTLAGAAASEPLPPSGAAVPQPPQRGGGPQVATLPPSDSPRDHYDLAYGYVMRKDYALAEESFRGFLRRFPGDRLVPDAQYWLGESMYQRQRWRDAAEVFLGVSTKFETSARAPDALLRLGQALAQLGEREAACASLAEVLRKYPRASVAIRQGVEREQKRVRC
ncbi:MAG: tol-pal system protein YbgF [Hyphomicrobiales bacterium]|nr:tol-pal system protein YbgF [Hyphomicrobiales bacterium]